MDLHSWGGCLLTASCIQNLICLHVIEQDNVAEHFPKAMNSLILKEQWKDLSILSFPLNRCCICHQAISSPATSDYLCIAEEPICRV